MESAIANTDLKIKVTNKQILSIALPITLAILIPQVNLLTNSIFLGWYDINALGDAGITGVFYLIFAVVGSGLNNAMQSIFSNYAGKGDSDAFKTILAQGIRLSLQFAVVGIAFTFLIAPFILQAVADVAAYPKEIGFLRIRILGLPFLYLFLTGNAFLVASLNSRYLMIGFICEALVNILLDYVLINGYWGFPKMGFNGASVASVIAEAVGALVVWVVLIKTGLKTRYGLFKNLNYNKPISKAILKVSTPLIVQYVISITTWLIFFFLIESRHEPISKAVSNVMRNVFGVAGVFVWAFASTSNVVVSNLMGQGKQEKVLEAIIKIMLWSIGFCCIMVLLLNIFPQLFFSLFGQGNEFVQAGVPVARMVSVGMLCMSVATIWLNAVTGTGKTKVNLLIEIVAVVVYLIHSWVFTKTHYISLAVSWSNEIIYWVTIFIMAFMFLKSGRWKTK
jgi:multidrug resistance protein, MATE family